MSQLTRADGLILLLYLAYVLGMGVLFKARMKTALDFFQAGRALPAWICGLAFVSISVGAPELIGLSGLGARYGLVAAQFYGIGAIPAMVFTGLFMMPVYYGSKARTLPEFLRLRFDEKTRILYACLFLAMTVFSGGIALGAMTRVAHGLHLFDRIFVPFGSTEAGAFTFTVGLSLLFVLAYVELGGLAAAIYNQAAQFLLMVAGLLPLVFLGLNNVGGWAGLKAAVPSDWMHEWRGALHSGGMGIDAIGICVGLGLVLGGGYWCTNFVVIQTAMAAQNTDAARRVPLIAAIPRMLLPFLVILPGVLAISLPTPHSVTTVTTNADGSIIHNIEVASPEAAAGKGIVPARINAATNEPLQDAAGKPLLDYDLAMPNMLLHYLPTGMLGLGLTALLAALMSGLAGHVTAFNSVFTCDLYQSSIYKNGSDGHYLVVGRWATVGGVLLAIGSAYATLRFHSILDALLLVFSIVNAPALATFLLGMFWKRATGHGAFVGLVAGPAAAVLHYGLTLPLNAHMGVHGAWIGVIHSYPSAIEQNLWGALLAFCATALFAIVVSLITKPRPEMELKGLVYSLMPKPAHANRAWWQRPEALGVAVLIGAIALNIFLA